MTLPIQLDRKLRHSLQEQLMGQLRQLISQKKLKPNSRMISTRYLAEQIGVSRTTVLLVYEELISEGFLETRPYVGTFVCADPPAVANEDEASGPNLAVTRQKDLFPGQGTDLLPAREYLDVGVAPECGAVINFSPGQPILSNILPKRAWQSELRKIFSSTSETFAAGEPAGLPALRRTFADRLLATRGVAVSVNQIFIFPGRRQAFNMIAHLFQRRGDAVVIEAPGNEEMASLFEWRGARLIRVPVDEQGLDTRYLPDSPVCLAYVTASCQHPLGGVMPVGRRTELIAWARGKGAYVIEDESDSAIRYLGSHPPPLFSLDSYGLTFFVDSFSEILGSGLGLSCLVVPPEFIKPVQALKAISDDGCSQLEQRLVAGLLKNGAYDRHQRQLRKQCLERRDCLSEALHKHFGDVKLMGCEVGTRLTWLLPEGFPPARLICTEASKKQLELGSASGDEDAISPYHDRALIFSYRGSPTEEIRRGIAMLRDVVSGINWS